MPNQTDKGSKHKKMSRVVLTCGHTLEFPMNCAPTIGEDMYCKKCNMYKAVEITEKDEFRTVCLDCRYGRLTGADYDEARAKASKHVINRNTHRVRVFNGDKLITTITQDEGQGELPFDGIVKDRITANEKHQNSLREVYERGSTNLGTLAVEDDTDFGTLDVDNEPNKRVA